MDETQYSEGQEFIILVLAKLIHNKSKHNIMLCILGLYFTELAVSH